MRELPITCVTAETAKKLNAADADLKKQIEKAKTPEALRAIANKLRLRVRVAEGTVAQHSSRISFMKSEIHALQRSRKDQRATIRVLSAEVASRGVENHADAIAESYNLDRIPF